VAPRLDSSLYVESWMDGPASDKVIVNNSKLMIRDAKLLHSYLQLRQYQRAVYTIKQRNQLERDQRSF
jgi:hypothetical protein